MSMQRLDASDGSTIDTIDIQWESVDIDTETPRLIGIHRR